MSKRREIQVFSLSFLDCICCGFGAIILIFILTLGRRPDINEHDSKMIKDQITKIVSDIDQMTRDTATMKMKLDTFENERPKAEAKIIDAKKSVLELQNELSLLLKDRSALTEERDKLLGEKKALPTRDETPPIPIPNPQRRQYLTGFNFEGEYVLFVIEASGGMLGYNVDDALAKLSLTDDEKRKCEKWQRTIKSIQWIIANLGPKQNYQIVLFNKDVEPLIPERAEDWFEPLDRKTTADVLKHLNAYVPHSGANFEHAFAYVKEKFAAAESIVLITDGLPNLADSYSVGPTADERDRERCYRAALREVPRHVPINILLFPMSGDPAAAFLLWEMASNSRGSLISPAQSWPGI